MSGKADFRSLESYALTHADPGDTVPSGQQELLELHLSQYLR